MNFEAPESKIPVSIPEFGLEASALAAILRNFSASELGKLMNISVNLAMLNHERYQYWHKPGHNQEEKQALLAYRGDVYNGLQAESMENDDLLWAQDHLRILSGLYGVLRPLDMIMPYRLEMGTPLSGKGFRDLYDYWGQKIRQYFSALAAEEGSGILMNLASAEYSRVVDWKSLGIRVITPVFKEYRNGEYRFLSMFGKKARGMMARYIIERRIKDPEEVKLFSEDSYTYHDPLSADDEWVFTR